MKLKLIEKAIGDHCFDGWPRMVGFPRQSLYHSLDKLLKKFWLRNGDSKGIYVSIFPEHLKEFRLFNKFYFDIDKEGDIKGAIRDSAKMTNFMMDYFDVPPRKLFSGYKGTAEFLDIEDKFGAFKDYPIVHMRLSQLIREETKADTIDDQVIGDVSRISRVPFSIHKTTGLLCIPIHIDWTFREIISHAIYYQGDYKINFNVAKMGTEGMRLLKYYDDTAEEYRESIKKKIKDGDFRGDLDLDLLLKAAPKLVGFRRLLMYRVIIPQLITNGKSSSEVHLYCKEFIERSGAIYDSNDKRFIDHYVNFNVNKEWHPQSTNSLFMQFPKLLEILT